MHMRIKFNQHKKYLILKKEDLTGNQTASLGLKRRLKYNEQLYYLFRNYNLKFW